jgi:hypothetical protein
VEFAKIMLYNPSMADYRFFATFAPGFERAVADLLSAALSDASGPEASGLDISSGRVLFSLDRMPPLDALPFLNNIYLILREWRTADCPFAEMVKQSARKSGIADVSIAREAIASDGIAPLSFRVRYSRANQFCSVDRPVMLDAERFISTATGMKSDRVTPDAEFWFIVRSEGWSCFAFQLTKKQTTEKRLEQGELRPEIAHLAVALARSGTGDFLPLQTNIARALDPFAGYGSLPECLCLALPEAKIYASDNSNECVDFLSRRFVDIPSVTVSGCDALSLTPIVSHSVDLIVTDPPWGFWENGTHMGAEPIITLYSGMLVEFDRVLSNSGRACILSGAKSEMETAVRNSSAFSLCADRKGFRTDILVNGKKCAVFLIERNPESGL